MTEEENRNLENIVGNLMVARYQVYRLEQKLGDEIDMCQRLGKELSTNLKYKYSNKLYKISTNIDRVE